MHGRHKRTCDGRHRDHRTRAEDARTYGRASDPCSWRGCGSKRRYCTKKEAKQAVNEARKAHGCGFYAYRCGECGGYHLTTKADQDWRVRARGGRGWATDGKREMRGGGEAPAGRGR